MRSFVFSVLLLACIALANGPRAWATSFYQQSFSDTVGGTPTIVRGTIGMSYADWGKTADGGKQIYTYYELKVSEVFKGQVSSPSIMIRELGGEKDGMGMQVAGASHFDRGEDVVVLLSEKNSTGSYDVWGLMMGKYNIVKDQNGDEVLAGAGLNGDADGHGAQNSDTKWTLEALRHLVQSQRHSGPSPKSSQSLTQGPAQPSLVTPVPAGKNVPAPQLQPPTDEESGASQKPSFSILVGIGLALGGLIVLLIGWRGKGLRSK